MIGETLTLAGRRYLVTDERAVHFMRCVEGWPVVGSPYVLVWVEDAARSPAKVPPSAQDAPGA